MTPELNSPAVPRKSNVWFWSSVGVVTAVVIATIGIFYKGFGVDPHEVPFMMRGQPAPAFTLRRLDNNEPLSLASMKGHPVVLNFWASWCGPCAQEHPVLRWGVEKFGKDVQFAGIVFEDKDDDARKFLSQNGAFMPQLSDPQSRTSVDYGVAGVPETYFIDGNGIIVDKYVGPIPPDALVENIKKISGPVAAK
ncbi:MAG: TlpA family protein disulfide reductase [Myxococcaceae bacterium]